MTSVEEKKQISEDVETVNSETEKGITLNDQKEKLSQQSRFVERNSLI